MLSVYDNVVDDRRRERIRHGTAAFPYACYHDDLAREEVPWHWHDELEAAIVTQGSIRVAFGGEQCDELCAGFFVNAGVLHSCDARTPGRCRLHSMCFHPRLIGGVESAFHLKYVLPIAGNRGFAGMCLHRRVDWQAEVLDALERAWQACAGEPPRYELEVRYALTGALAGIAEHLAGLRTEASPKSIRDGERIMVMLRFIMDNYGEAIGVADIARSAAVSESECLRCFRSAIGTTPIRYLREYRIERAAGRLAAGEAPVAEVAARCGFSDVSYFTKTFREMKGATPKEYQRTHAREGEKGSAGD